MQLQEVFALAPSNSCIISDNLISLFNAGHRKLVPLSEKSFPQKMTEEDRVKIKTEGFDISANCESWFSFIYDNPSFWNKERLGNQYYSSKFVNVAATQGYWGQDEYLSQLALYGYVFDIDSGFVVSLIGDPSLLQNEKVKWFIKSYDCYLPNSENYISFFEWLKKVTYVTKTKKGFHIYWIEDSQKEPIVTCYDGREFEIKTGKLLTTLPPSRHRHDPIFHYSSIGATTVRNLNGLYDLLADLLKDCYRKNRSPPTNTSFNSVNLKVRGTLNEVNASKLIQIVRPYYKKPNRQKIAMGLSGLLCKYGISQEQAASLIAKLCMDTDDDERHQRLSTVKATYEKGIKQGLDNITGSSLLKEIIHSQIPEDDEDLAGKTIEEIKRILSSQASESGAEASKDDNSQVLEPISVYQAMRKHAGVVKVQGVVFSRYPFRWMVKSEKIHCLNCENTFQIKYKKPEFATDKNIRCSSCNSKNLAIDHDFINAVVIELRDPNSFSDLDTLKAILFYESTREKDPTRSFLIGERITITGKMHPLNTKSGYDPCLYAHSVEFHSQKEIILSAMDRDAIYRIGRRENVIDFLVKMFAPSVIGHNRVKEGLLLSAVSSGDDLESIRKNKQRKRIHALLVGSPGNGKTLLLSEAVKLVQGSRLESAQHSTGKSLVAIVAKEDENIVLRIGPVPLAKEALCAINEIGEISIDQQANLHDVMQEGRFTINKHGINEEIRSPTVILASANPINEEWKYENGIDFDEMRIKKTVLDRFDLVFIFRSPSGEKEIKEFAKKKSEQSKKIIPDYSTFLTKYLMVAKTIHPKFTDEAIDMITDYYVKTRAVKKGSPRLWDTLFRLTEARAKIKLKEIVDIREAIETLEFYNSISQEYNPNAPDIPPNPRDIAYNECLSVLQNVKGPLLFDEMVKAACMKNEHVKAFLGNDPKLRETKRLRPIRDMLRNHSHIREVSQKPLTLQYFSDDDNNIAVTSKDQSPSTSGNDECVQCVQCVHTSEEKNNSKNTENTENNDKNEFEKAILSSKSENHDNGNLVKGENNFSNTLEDRTQRTHRAHSDYTNYSATTREIVNFLSNTYTKSINLDSSPVRSIIKKFTNGHQDDTYICKVDNYPSPDWAKIEEHIHSCGDTEHRDRLYSIAKYADRKESQVVQGARCKRIRIKNDFYYTN